MLGGGGENICLFFVCKKHQNKSIWIIKTC